MAAALPAEKAKKAEIRRRYRRKGKFHTAPQIAALRLKDLARLFRARYGLALPDDDAGRDDLQVALSHIAPLANSRTRMERYIEIWAPWLTVREARALINQSLTDPQVWRADQLAWRLRLTAADRATLGITTIGAIDMNKAARTRARKERSKERSRAYRLRLKAANAP